MLSNKFKPRISHNWWDTWGSSVWGTVSDSVSSWFTNQGKEIDQQTAVSVANANLQASTLANQLKEKESANSTKIALIVGGSIVAVVLIVVVVAVLRKK